MVIEVPYGLLVKTLIKKSFILIKLPTLLRFLLGVLTGFESLHELIVCALVIPML